MTLIENAGGLLGLDYTGGREVVGDDSGLIEDGLLLLDYS